MRTSLPKLLAMLSIQAPIKGDETLLRLAQYRLADAGLGGEFYPGSPSHLRHLLSFRPGEFACVAHLPRGINLLSTSGRETIQQFAEVAAGQLHGILLHDQTTFADQPQQTLNAMRDMEHRLSGLAQAPRVFIEYAAGLAPEFFASLFEETADLSKVCAAIDISHVGIHLCRQQYAQQHPNEDVCRLRPDHPDLPKKIDAIQDAVAATQALVNRFVERLSRLDKPLHFHLHDGHPLSTFSLFGVSDHLSFLQSIRLPFAYQGRHTLDGIFGVNGLTKLIHTVMQQRSAEQLSFTVEMHPQAGHTPLGEYASLFSHWRDTSQATHMNYWLDMLTNNATLVRHACQTAA